MLTITSVYRFIQEGQHLVLFPVIANLIVEHVDVATLQQTSHPENFHRCYIDDMFVILH